MAEQHVFEVEIRVQGADPANRASVHREYTSIDAASAEKAAQELVAGFEPTTANRFKPVLDQD